MMRALATLGRYRLYPGELLRLDFGRRIGLRCGRGSLLVTAGPEGIERELHWGDRMVCGGLILVEGVGDLLVEEKQLPFLPYRRANVELINPVTPQQGENS